MRWLCVDTYLSPVQMDRLTLISEGGSSHSCHVGGGHLPKTETEDAQALACGRKPPAYLLRQEQGLSGFSLILSWWEVTTLSEAV